MSLVRAVGTIREQLGPSALIIPQKVSYILLTPQSLVWLGTPGLPSAEVHTPAKRA